MNMNLDIEQATEIAMKYAEKAGYPYSKIESIRHEDGHWIVAVKIDLLSGKEKIVTIDDQSGKVTGYE